MDEEGGREVEGEGGREVEEEGGREGERWKGREGERWKGREGGRWKGREGGSRLLYTLTSSLLRTNSSMYLLVAFCFSNLASSSLDTIMRNNMHTYSAYR